MSKHILVVANQTIGGASLLELVKERAKEPDTSFTLVVPMTRPRSGYVIYDDAVRESAQVRLDLTLSYLRGEDVVASGELGDEDPYTATLDALHEYQPDEVIISTLPSSSSYRCRPAATAAPPRSPARAWGTRWTRCVARGCWSPAWSATPIPTRPR